MRLRAGIGKTAGAILLKIPLSLVGLISSGEPRVHNSHQCRFALLRRVLAPQVSQTKNSVFMRQDCTVALFCKTFIPLLPVLHRRITGGSKLGEERSIDDGTIPRSLYMYTSYLPTAIEGPLGRGIWNQTLPMADCGMVRYSSCAWLSSRV